MPMVTRTQLYAWQHQDGCCLLTKITKPPCVTQTLSYILIAPEYFLTFLCFTGKSLSEALILASTNQQYDDRLFIELQVQYEKSKLKPGENMLCTEFFSEIQNNFCTQHVLPRFWKRRASDKDLPVCASYTTYIFLCLILYSNTPRYALDFAQKT